MGVRWRGLVGVALVLCPHLAWALPTTLSAPAANSAARDEMRELSDGLAVLIYPAAYRATAERTLAELHACVAALRQRLPDSDALGPVHVVLHTGVENNAYVDPAAGGWQRMVLPMHMNQEIFNLFNLGMVDSGVVACHEALHYTMYQQRHGLWGAINRGLGTLVLPEDSFDRWFHEGVATYYESRLTAGGRGRPASPWWRGLYAAKVAGQGHRLHAGHLNILQRRSIGPAGNAAYLDGMHFIEYLVHTYGEATLWQLIRSQNSALVPPLALTLRFAHFYGRDIDGLYRDYGAWIDSHVPVRRRPPDQRPVVEDIGRDARLSSCPGGQRLAVVSQSADRPPELTVRRADGGVLWRRLLTDVFPRRHHIFPQAMAVSGMGFTADCRQLFFVLSDLGRAQEYTSALWQLDAESGRSVHHWPLEGLGGDVSPDGRAYAYVALEGASMRLEVLDLASQSRTVRHAPAEGVSLLGPTFAPTGDRIAFLERRPHAGYDLKISGPGGPPHEVHRGLAFAFAPRWQDADHLIMMHGDTDRVQAVAVDVRGGPVQALTDVPYALMDPVLGGDGTLKFLNAERYAWNLEEVPWPRPGPLQVAALAAAPVSAPATPAAGVDTETGPLAVREGPHRTLPDLLVPSLRAPTLNFTVSRGALSELRLGTTLAGQDRLTQHNVALDLSYEIYSKQPQATVTYLNQQAAPWTGALALSMGRSRGRARASVGRAFWGTELSLGVDATYFPHGVNADHRQLHWLAGPAVSLAYSGNESTPYAGSRRALSLLGELYLRPNQVHAPWGFALAHAQIGVNTPLPLSRRHTLGLLLRGYRLLGTDKKLLPVGGVWAGDHTLNGFSYAPVAPRRLGALTPAQALDAVAVRGLEDSVAIREQALIFGAAYRYPLILDHGWHSLLYLLPAPFVRQLDLEAFSNLDLGPNWAHSRLVVGGQLRLSFAIGNASFNMGYRGAVRPQLPAAYRHLHLWWIGTGFS